MTPLTLNQLNLLIEVGARLTISENPEIIENPDALSEAVMEFIRGFCDTKGYYIPDEVYAEMEQIVGQDDIQVVD